MQPAIRKRSTGLMIRIFAMACCALLAGGTLHSAERAGKNTLHPLMNSGTVIWAGLDYSMVPVIKNAESELKKYR